jgi:hypothetical protein
MPPPSLTPERAKVAEFYSAGSGTIPPLPWQTFPPPFSAGTVDTVTRGIEANLKRQQVDWIFCYTYSALIPHATLMTSIERFWTKVIPCFV